MSTDSSSILDDANIFKQLEEYDWDKDKEFQGGLEAILGPNSSPSQTHELTLRAQCFYLSRKKGIPIDFNAYKSYLASRPPSKSEIDSQTPHSPISSSTLPTYNVLSSQSTTTPSTSDLSPRVPRHLPPTSSQIITEPTSLSTTAETENMPPAASTSDPKQAPYPATFAEIVAMITSGTPIPGIVDIPPIVLHGQGSKPTMKKRRKPWEMHKTEEEVQGNGEGTFGDRRDIYIPQQLPEDEVKVFKEK